MNVNNAALNVLTRPTTDHAAGANQRKQNAIARLDPGVNAPRPAGAASPTNASSEASSKELVSFAGAEAPGIGIARGEADPLTVEGLMKAWGEKGSRYDLDGDGTVGMSDLVALLSRLGQGPNAAPEGDDPAPGVGTDKAAPPTLEAEAPAAAVVADAPPDPLTVDGLMQAWGEKGSVYDLDGDGTVGMSDLVALLARLGAGPSAPADDVTASPGIGETVVSDASIPSIDAAPSPAPAEGAPDSSMIDRLMEAWGQKGSRFDLDHDGIVGMSDLVAMLARLSGTEPNGRRDEDGLAALRPGLANRPEHTNQEGPTRRLANALIGRLKAGGFGDHPPANIHDLVARLDLAPGRSQSLLNHIARQYPQGLGLDVVG